MVRTCLCLVALLVVALTGEVSAPRSHADPTPAVVNPVVLAEVPHDSAAYTEGLEFDGPVLYEGTGKAGESQLRELDPETGAVRRAVPLPGSYFGEGITVVGDRIWQLTYRDGVAIEWDKRTFTPVREVALPGERWGVCLDGNRLIVSDGTARLRFLDVETLRETGAVDVTRAGRPQVGINELECVDGRVWTNAWPTDDIVRIDPTTGEVDLVVDASGLWRFGARDIAQVLSGIAHIERDEFLVTGKEWPAAFRVRIPGA